MKLFFAVLAITGTTFVSAENVNARPYIYSHSYEYRGTHQKCIAQAKTVLQNNGFGDFTEDQYLEIRASEIKGYHDDESLTVVIECNQKIGITNFAVSGLDNDLTYKMHKVFNRAKW